MRDITLIRLIRARKAHVCDVCKKQIICGDFYWLATLPSSKESKGKVCQSCIEKLKRERIEEAMEAEEGKKVEGGKAETKKVEKKAKKADDGKAEAKKVEKKAKKADDGKAEAKKVEKKANKADDGNAEAKKVEKKAKKADEGKAEAKKIEKKAKKADDGKAEAKKVDKKNTRPAKVAQKEEMVGAQIERVEAKEEMTKADAGAERTEEEARGTERMERKQEDDRGGKRTGETIKKGGQEKEMNGERKTGSAGEGYDAAKAGNILYPDPMIKKYYGEMYDKGVKDRSEIAMQMLKHHLSYTKQVMLEDMMEERERKFKSKLKENYTKEQILTMFCIPAVCEELAWYYLYHAIESAKEEKWYDFRKISRKLKEMREQFVDMVNKSGQFDPVRMWSATWTFVEERPKDFTVMMYSVRNAFLKQWGNIPNERTIVLLYMAHSFVLHAIDYVSNVQAELFSKFHITMPNMTHNTYDLQELINKTIEPYAINPLEGNVDMATRIIMKQIPDNIVDEDECDCKVSHKF